MEKLISRKVKRTQSKYELVEKNVNQQSSYNLSQELKNILLEKNALQLEDSSKGRDVYALKSDYALILDESLYNIINTKYKTINNSIKFLDTVSSDGTNKFMLARKINKDHGNNWFVDLYDNNIENAIFELYIDDENKNLIIKNNLPNDYFQYDYGLVEMDTEEFDNVKDDDIVIQKILYGVPGTGKSTKVSEIVEKYYPEYKKRGSEYIFRVTIHPEYTYFDFIGNILPTVKKDNGDSIIEYSFNEGIFTKALKKAIKNPKKHVYLLIEEMSRGNIASIFGDIFQLLDRDENGISEYGIHNSLISNNIYSCEREIKLPSNFNIIGTVNTSDQNVYVMDNAFKRRFDFEYVTTAPIGKLNSFSFELENKSCNWLDFYTKFNDYIVRVLKLAEDKQIGQFFYKYSHRHSKDENYSLFCNKILNYIWFDIHTGSMIGKSIIDDKVVSFEDAYKKLKNHENIFKEDFFTMLDMQYETN